MWRKSSADQVEYSCRIARFYSNFSVEERDGKLRGGFLAERNRSYFAVVDYSDDPIRPDLEIVDRWLSITKSYWREWNLFNYYRGPHQRIVRRSAVTLKLLTYAPTGAFVAAPTTSLPERIGGDRNWDYRYVWVRDTSLFVDTLFRLGYSGEAKAFMSFMLNQCAEEYDNRMLPASEKPKALKVLYPIQPGSVTDESFLSHLSGYRRSSPVRIGNGAARQFQLDNYGHLLEAFYYFRHTGGTIDSKRKKLIDRLAEEVVLYWQEPDNGIWETPTKKHYAYSKIMAWVALERALALGASPSERLKKASATIRHDVLNRGLAQAAGREFLAEAYGSDGVDASGLLAFTNGFLSKPLALSTREEIERRLISGAFVYRNREQREGQKEGAFLICTSWWISHLIREGELGRAEEILSQVLDHASPLGLFAEEFDPESGEFLGNFPQAFSHLGLINTILNLEHPKRILGITRSQTRKNSSGASDPPSA